MANVTGDWAKRLLSERFIRTGTWHMFKHALNAKCSNGFLSWVTEAILPVYGTHWRNHRCICRSMKPIRAFSSWNASWQLYLTAHPTQGQHLLILPPAIHCQRQSLKPRKGFLQILLQHMMREAPALTAMLPMLTTTKRVTFERSDVSDMWLTPLWHMTVFCCRVNQGAGETYPDSRHRNLN